MDAFVIAVETSDDAPVIYTSESMWPLLGYNSINCGANKPKDFNDNKQSDEPTNDESTNQPPLTSVYELLHDNDRISFSKILQLRNGSQRLC